MVCVGVCLQDFLNLVTLSLGEGEQSIRRVGGDGLRRWVIVQNGVDDDSRFCGRVCDDVLPGTSECLEDIMYCGLFRRGGAGAV